MIKCSDFNVVTCTAIGFTPDGALSPRRFLANFLDDWSSVFDGEPTVIPNVDGLPAEVPRLTWADKAGAWRCEVSPARMSFVWQLVAGGEQTPALMGFFSEAAGRLCEYAERQDERVGRLAAVARRIVEIEDPGRLLAQHFCQERWQSAPLNRPGNFEVHAHKVYDLDGFRVNSWVRNRGTQVLKEGEQTPVVLVEQDFNTLDEEAATADFGAAEIVKFYAAASGEFDEVLRLFFPEEE